MGLSFAALESSNQGVGSDYRVIFAATVEGSTLKNQVSFEFFNYRSVVNLSDCFRQKPSQTSCHFGHFIRPYLAYQRGSQQAALQTGFV